VEISIEIEKTPSLIRVIEIFEEKKSIKTKKLQMP